MIPEEPLVAKQIRHASPLAAGFGLKKCYTEAVSREQPYRARRSGELQRKLVTCFAKRYEPAVTCSAHARLVAVTASLPRHGIDSSLGLFGKATPPCLEDKWY